MSENSTVVLCGASAYEEKYYLNKAFANLPTQIKEELQIMCVLFTHDGDGELMFRTQAAEDDYSYDEIGAELKIKELQREKEDLLRSLQLYYQVLTRGIDSLEL